MSEPACTIVLEGPKPRGTFILTLTSPFAGSLRLNGESYSNLQSVGKQVRASLERSQIGTLDLKKEPDAELMFEALEEINEAGWVALSALVSDARFPAQPMLLQQYLSRVLERAPGTMTPVMRFVSPLDLPIDLMPALQPPPRARFRRNGAQTLYEQARTWFVGLQFVVQKIRSGSEDYGTDLIGAREFPDGRRVVLAPYRHAGLKGVDRVRRELSELGFFEVLHPLPDDAFIRLRDYREAADLIVRGREPPEGPEGIVHITSHCDAGDTLSPLDHCLRLAGGGIFARNELRVTVKALKSGGRAVAQHGPLAIITACGPADVSYDSPVSIPDALLYAGFRCVVSPLVSVNVDPGYAVTLFLYEAMKRGMSVGAALVEARKQLLKKHGHTLGLLHACYGDTRLRFDAEVVALPVNRTPRIAG
jgi:hypothetical protein